MALITARRTPPSDTDGIPSRRAGRQSRARLTDARVWGGLVLLAVAAILGAALLGRGSETVLVLQAGRDLSVGSQPHDAVPVAVPVDVAGAYLAADDAVDGRLRWPVAAGELIPRAALSVPAAYATRGVTVPIEPGHAPSALVAGDLVDVWTTPADAGGLVQESAGPTLVLQEASVVGVGADVGGFGGALAVELAVPADRVGELVAAARRGVLDLVAVPLESQRIRP